MIKQLEDSKNMEAEERARLEDEIRVKQHEVQSIYDQVSNSFQLLLFIHAKNTNLERFFIAPSTPILSDKSFFKLSISFLGPKERRGKQSPSTRNGWG